MVDQELGTLGLLLRRLLSLDSLSKFGTELQIDNGHVIEQNVEVSQSGQETHLDLLRNLLTLSQQGRRIVLRNNRSHDFVDDRGQNSRIIVHAKVAIDGL